jgi:hypothetical protein
MTNEYFLSHGSHATPQQGRCAMEWVSYIAGEPHSDTPACVSPVLRGFGISLNDNWDDEQRQKLRPYLARCIGTAGDGRDKERGWLAMDWLIRVFTPRFLDLVPELHGHAARLRALSPVMASVALDDAMIVLADARQTSDAAWAAAWAAAGAAAGDAAGDAERCLGRCRGRCQERCQERCLGRCQGRCRGRCLGRCLGRCQGRCQGRPQACCCGSSGVGAGPV